MSTPLDSSDSQRKSDNTYAVDSENAAEMARLMRQDHLLTTGMGGLFPERSNLDGIHQILDIACGPGGWVMETAFQYPDKDVFGGDISQQMIAYAQAQAQVQGLANAHFQVMNALKSLEFADESFGLVNSRFIVAFMLPNIWPSFLKECMRILSPSGIIRLTEPEWGFSNTPAFERFCGLFNQALHNAGQSFSPNGLHMGIQPVLPRLLKNAGYINIQRKSHSIDFSYGTDAHEGFYHDLKIGFKLVQPFLLKWQVAGQETIENLYNSLVEEMQSEEFCAIWSLLTVWGEKPATR